MIVFGTWNVSDKSIARNKPINAFSRPFRLIQNFHPKRKLLVWKHGRSAGCSSERLFQYEWVKKTVSFFFYSYKDYVSDYYTTLPGRYHGEWKKDHKAPWLPHDHLWKPAALLPRISRQSYWQRCCQVFHKKYSFRGRHMWTSFRTIILPLSENRFFTKRFLTTFVQKLGDFHDKFLQKTSCLAD